MRHDIYFAAKKVLFEGVPKEELLNELLLKSNPNSSKTITTMFYGTLRMYFPFQVQLKKINQDRSLKKDIKLLATMAYVQFFQMDSIPDYAVMDEMIKTLPAKFKNVKKHFTWLLHEILRVGKDLDFSGFLPEYMADELKLSIGANFALDYEDFILRPSKKYFCLDSKKGVDGAIRLDDNYPFFSINGLGSQVQDQILSKSGVICELNSMLIPYYFRSSKGKDHLDLCSAPGSKLLCAKIRYKNDNIVGVEKDTPRFISLEKRVGDLVKVYNNDALDYLANEDKFDRIVLDAPCSGLGTLASNPEWLEFKDESVHHKKLPGIQKKLLKKALSKLKPNGQLIYSVCTFSKSETQDVVRDVLGDDFQVVKLSNLIGEKQVSTEYGSYLLPSKKLGNQIFFVSMIEAKS